MPRFKNLFKKASSITLAKIEAVLKNQGFTAEEFARARSLFSREDLEQQQYNLACAFADQYLDIGIRRRYLSLLEKEPQTFEAMLETYQQENGKEYFSTKDWRALSQQFYGEFPSVEPAG